MLIVTWNTFLANRAGEPKGLHNTEGIVPTEFIIAS